MMTTDQRAELDAAMAKATKGPWGADGLRDNRIVWSGPENRVCFMAIYPKAHADSLAIVALHNAYPLLTATIDAQAAEIARLREALGESFMVSVADFGKYYMKLSVPDLPTLDRLHDALIAARANPNGDA